MSQNSLGQKKQNKSKEKKVKEEPNQNIANSDFNFSTEIITMNYSENLDLIVSEMKINKTKIESFEHYEKKINKILREYNTSTREIDYRDEQMGKLLNSNKDDMEVDSNLSKGNNDEMIEKMKRIGKIGEYSTEIDKYSASGLVEIKNGLRVTSARDRFSSVRASNCVFSGKWCYEITLLTNKLCQIGWCSYNTPFKYREGVGDDLTSYAYDGWRVLKWHLDQSQYGQNWDIGDVIGVCIDLENKTIEFYQNGLALGIAFKNIPTGPNLAYFPAASLGKNEKILFNFGATKSAYEYKGYNFLDIPPSTYNNSYEVTKQLLSIMKNNILKLLQLEEIEWCYKIKLSYRIFNFLLEVSLKDYQIFQELILPFLIDNSNYLKTIIDFLLLFSIQKVKFVNRFMDYLSCYIELSSTKGFEGINQIEQLINLYIQILNITDFVQTWLDGRNYVHHLKQIFNGNYLKMHDIIDSFNKSKQGYSFGLNERDTIKYDLFKKFYFKFRQELEEKYEIEGMASYENKINHIYTNLISFFLQNDRVYEVNSKNITLKSILIEVMPKSYKESFSNDMEIFYFSGSRMGPNEAFIKYFFFNILAILNSKFSLNFDKFSIEPWFSRNIAGNIYFDEVGMGGSILHATKEYGEKIESRHKEPLNDFNNYLLHRVIDLLSSYILPSVKDYAKFHTEIRNYDLHSFEIDKLRCFGNIRSYLSIFNKSNQVLLYQFSFFLVKWFNKLIKENSHILYFLPKSCMSIPYEIFSLFFICKSHLFKPELKELRLKANEISPHFVEDDYIKEILYFYCYLLNDSNIANPEYKEGFVLKVTNFLKDKSLKKIFEENENLMELLIKGLIKNMAIEPTSDQACESIIEFIRPCLFGEAYVVNKDIIEKNTKLVNLVKKFFENNPETFFEFMEKYNKILNKVMTDYTLILSEAGKKLNREVSGVPPVFKKLVIVYEDLCKMMKILEFLLMTYSKDFLDIKSINFSRLSNFLKNLSSRILDKPYFNNLINYISITYTASFHAKLCEISSAIVGVFIKIYENKHDANFNNFVTKLVSLSDFDLEPFYSVTEYKLPDEHHRKGYDLFKDCLDLFCSMKVNKVVKKMSESEWEEITKKDNICIICYLNLADAKLMPCKHVCCSECLRQYLIDKKNCFICNTLIENTEEINNVN